jgi:hypothetical protein
LRSYEDDKIFMTCIGLDDCRWTISTLKFLLRQKQRSTVCERFEHNG